jgi:hypothetical protein
MFIGTFGAINQTKIKRLFAYSSIAHIGYMLLGLATGTIEAVESLLIYIIVYIFMIINVFAVILATPRHEVLPHFASASMVGNAVTSEAFNEASENDNQTQGRPEGEQVAANSSFRSSISCSIFKHKMAPNVGFAAGDLQFLRLKASYPL